MTDPLVSTQWLAQHLGHEDVRLVDATWFMPNEPRTGRQSFTEGHIPGAVFFEIDAIADRSTDLPHMLPSAEAFAAAASELGLRRDQSVVVYDAQGVFSSPRVWWTLRAMGFPKVQVLDGGLPKWRTEGHPIETGEPKPAQAQIAAEFDASLVVGLPAMQALVENGGAQILDARPAARFKGEASEPRPGLPSGHMPGAVNVPWGSLVNTDGTFKSASDLKPGLEAAGVSLDGPIVATCGSGVTAAIIALALARLGRPDVAIYDGSWAEWAGRGNLPIING